MSVIPAWGGVGWGGEWSTSRQRQEDLQTGQEPGLTAAPQAHIQGCFLAYMHALANVHKELPGLASVGRSAGLQVPPEEGGRCSEVRLPHTEQPAQGSE